MAANQKPNTKTSVLEQSSVIKAYGALWAPMNLFQGVLKIVLWCVTVIIVVAAAHELFRLQAHGFDRDYRSIDA